MKKALFCFSVLMIAGIVGCATHSMRSPASMKDLQNSDSFQEFVEKSNRGSASEYDPGPEKGSTWARLFGSAPNYRAFGKTILKSQSEKFRWMFGPMWYRGRLGTNQVKVFVVGQEGAQDENVTNRAFTGSTGTKTQKFLNHLGIYQSYLFLNTFIYTINGQLEPDNAAFNWMEQGLTSPIVQYRHRLFDNMAYQNSAKLSLLMGVGSGGKNSLATWISARGGKCSPAQEMASCDTSGMSDYFFNVGVDIDGKPTKFKLQRKLLVIGVPHPGGANPNLGGDAALQNIIRGFTNAAKKVAKEKMARMNSGDSQWLQLDPEEPFKNDLAKYQARLESDYRYGNAPVPYRDFAFGTNWRMGADGTSSNRWGADAIQVFSSKGDYGDKSAQYSKPRDSQNFLYYRASKDGNPIVSCGGDSASGSGEDVTVEGTCNGLVEMMDDDLQGLEPDYDVAYEHPRHSKKDSDLVNRYDYGPCGYLDQGADSSKKDCELSQLLMGWGELNAQGVKPTSHASLGFGPSYRGRLDNAKILVIADQESHDDLFSARAWTGGYGQKLQTLLMHNGSSYGILRTLPVDTLGQDDASVAKLVQMTMPARKRIVDFIGSMGKTQVVLLIGPFAQSMREQIKFVSSNAIISLPMPDDAGTHIAAWNQAQNTMRDILNSGFSSGAYEGQMTAIPRRDLPYSTRWWMGTSGSRAARGEGGGEIHGHYYRVFAPRWIRGLTSKPLTKEQKAELSVNMKKEGLSL